MATDLDCYRTNYPPGCVTTYGAACGTAIHALCERVEQANRERDDARTEAELMKQAGRVLEQQRDEARAEVVKLHTWLTSAEQEGRRLRALLREVQWGEGWGCPVCLAEAVTRTHAPGCRLAMALEGRDAD